MCHPHNSVGGALLHLESFLSGIDFCIKLNEMCVFSCEPVRPITDGELSRVTDLTNLISVGNTGCYELSIT